jgi:hypothetical protein
MLKTSSKLYDSNALLGITNERYSPQNEKKIQNNFSILKMAAKQVHFHLIYLVLKFII